MRQGQRALHSCGVGVALALRRVLFALSCAAAMQFAAISVQAQTPNADESTAASVSIPPNIPVKRDSVDATTSDADARWWIALAFIAGLVAWVSWLRVAEASFRPTREPGHFGAG